VRRVRRWPRLAADWMHLPDGPAADRRNARMQRADADIAWIHAYDVLDPRAEGAVAKTAAPTG
jgi:salicylate hydroxylase